MFGHNCFTDLFLSIGTGGVDVAYDWWESHKIALDTSIADGTARLFIPGEAQFRMHAEARGPETGHELLDDDEIQAWTRRK